MFFLCPHLQKTYQSKAPALALQIVFNFGSGEHDGSGQIHTSLDKMLRSASLHLMLNQLTTVVIYLVISFVIVGVVLCAAFAFCVGSAKSV